MSLAEVQSSEAITDASLVGHLPLLKPFISTKVMERIQNRGLEIEFSKPTNNENHHSSLGMTRNDDVTLIQQPAALNSVTMRDYQIFGLSWLVDRYNKGIHCILADEMGLGKTLQTISFFTHLKTQRNLGGPHLVVMPLSVLFNWMAECKKFSPGLRLLRIHTNNSAEANSIKVKLASYDDYDVLLTTYETLKLGKLQRFLHRIPYRSVFLDEGHRIKNMDSLTAKGCSLLKSRFKVILTGTPVQNNLHETYCLLHYLHPRVFDVSEAFDNAFEFSKSSVVVNRSSLENVHYMLRPFILRRVKSEVEQLLPPKLETLIRCPLSEMQRFWTKRLLLKESRSLQEMERGFTEGGTIKSSSASSIDWKKLQSLLAQLRKAANHPYMFPGAESIPDGSEGGAAPATEDIVTDAGKMVILDKLLKKLFAKNHRVVIFSQYTKTLDIISDYLNLRDYGFYRLDGSTNRVMREVYINLFNTKKSKQDPGIFILSTRAGGEGVNLFTADTVILYDSDWNPQVDIQAAARVHRIGQTKPVHIYRLVSAGTIEERIVQRAQKKLFLDSMVNRGSTAQSYAIDDNHTDGQEDNVDNMDTSSIFSSLKFGWNACFGESEGPNNFQLSDKDIDIIIDRRRGLGNAEFDNDPRNKSTFLSEGQSNVNDFVETVPLVSLRKFEGEDIGTFIDESVIENKNLMDLADRTGQVPEILEVTRARVSRFVDSEHVVGLGKMKILKINQYTLEAGEKSVFDQEGSSFNRSAFLDTKQAGNKSAKLENQDFCQSCMDGGELILCDHCPASYHESCLDPSMRPFRGKAAKGAKFSSAWSCPHHRGCSNVSCNAQAKSFAFRCEACPAAFCEDCLPVENTILGEHERWAQMGYKQPANSCIIYCSRACSDFTSKNQHLFTNTFTNLITSKRVAGTIDLYSPDSKSKKRPGASLGTSVSESSRPSKAGNNKK